jgi:hypothetical protein
MEKKLLLFIISFAVFSNSYSQALDWEWAKTACSLSNATSITAVTTDPSGNIFIAGNFRDSARFGNIIHHPVGTVNLFLAKYDSAGNFIWMRQAKGANSPPYDLATAICTDASGNCYVTGFFNGMAIFNSDTVISSGAAPDVFAAKYDPSGNVLWLSKAGGSGSDYSNGIGLDASGNCYIGGSFESSASFGSILLSANNSSTDMFIAKLDSHGGFINVTAAGGSSTDVLSAMTVDKNGTCCVTGTFNSPSIIFGTSTVTYTGSGTDGFIARFDALGNALWGQSAGGPANQEPSGIASDPAGNCYVTGVFKGDTMYFGNTTLVTYNYWDLFTAKYDSSGNLLWANHEGSSSFGPDAVFAITADSAGNCYTTGRFASPATFDTITVTAAGPADIFIAKFNSSGSAEWVRYSGSASNVLSSTSIHRNENGDLFITGGFELNTTVDHDSLLADSGFYSGYYIAKLGLPNTTGIPAEESFLNAFVLYPNPVTDQLNLSGVEEKSTVVISDLLGKEIFKSEGSGIRTINVKNYPPGMYLMEMKDGVTQLRKKFIKL